MAMSGMLACGLTMNASAPSAPSSSAEGSLPFNRSYSQSSSTGKINAELSEYGTKNHGDSPISTAYAIRATSAA